MPFSPVWSKKRRTKMLGNSIQDLALMSWKSPRKTKLWKMEISSPSEAGIIFPKINNLRHLYILFLFMPESKGASNFKQQLKICAAFYLACFKLLIIEIPQEINSYHHLIFSNYFSSKYFLYILMCIKTIQHDLSLDFHLLMKKKTKNCLKIEGLIQFL